MGRTTALGGPVSRNNLKCYREGSRPQWDFGSDKDPRVPNGPLRGTHLTEDLREGSKTCSKVGVSLRVHGRRTNKVLSKKKRDGKRMRGNGRSDPKRES